MFITDDEDEPELWECQRCTLANIETVRDLSDPSRPALPREVVAQPPADFCCALRHVLPSAVGEHLRSLRRSPRRSRRRRRARRAVRRRRGAGGAIQRREAAAAAAPFGPLPAQAQDPVQEARRGRGPLHRPAGGPFPLLRGEPAHGQGVRLPRRRARRRRRGAVAPRAAREARRDGGRRRRGLHGARRSLPARPPHSGHESARRETFSERPSLRTRLSPCPRPGRVVPAPGNRPVGTRGRPRASPRARLPRHRAPLRPRVGLAPRGAPEGARREAPAAAAQPPGAGRREGGERRREARVRRLSGRRGDGGIEESLCHRREARGGLALFANSGRGGRSARAGATADWSVRPQVPRGRGREGGGAGRRRRRRRGGRRRRRGLWLLHASETGPRGPEPGRRRRG